MTVVNMVVGAVTHNSARVVVKVSSTSNVRLLVSTNSSMTSPTFFGPVTPNATTLVASVTATGLAANTRYWWRIEHGGVVDTTYTGQFPTHPVAPGNPASFTFAAASCAGLASYYPGTGSVLAANRLSNNPVFDTIRTKALDENWLFFSHMGDFHYYDLGSNQHGIVGGGSVANYRRAYDDVFLQSRQHRLYREVPWHYVWDDHCYGPNDSDGTYVSKANAAQVYRERVPHYPLIEASGSIYHTFQIGRVLFVATDGRYNRSPNASADGPTKTMLGTAQKAWLGNLLSTSTAEAMVWLMQSQWIGSSTDTWEEFAYERDELTTMLRDTGWLGRMCMLYGDEHAIGINSGATNQWGGFPILMASSLDSSFGPPNIGRWDVAEEIQGRQQYGTVRVDDNGTDIAITLTGWINTTPAMWYTFNTSGKTIIPAGSPSQVLAL